MVTINYFCLFKIQVYNFKTNLRLLGSVLNAIVKHDGSNLLEFTDLIQKYTLFLFIKNYVYQFIILKKTECRIKILKRDRHVTKS